MKNTEQEKANLKANNMHERNLQSANDLTDFECDWLDENEDWDCGVYGEDVIFAEPSRACLKD